MAGNLQPLVNNQRIVRDDGTPTDYFIRWAQQKQIDISGGITAAEAEELIAAAVADLVHNSRQIIAGVGLSGGGNLAADRTIDLEDTAVAPGTYGDATHVGQFTVDQQGRLVAASNVPITGGGGGHQYEAFGALPLASTFTHGGNTTTSTATDGTKSLLIQWAGNGSNTVEWFLKAAPVAPFDVYMRVRPILLAGGNNSQFGIIIRNSTTGKLAILTINWQTAIGIQEWSSASAFSSSVFTKTIVGANGENIWLRVKNDGTNLVYYYSFDGLLWVQIASRALSTFIGSADQIGIAIVPFSIGEGWISSFGTTAPA